ncbi:MAG: FHA domain-containing protein [Actinomycetota bacterium]|nr:FHA domain-containing protein [Actinomycetota bacterium]
MPSQVLTFLKYIFLVVLYLFFVRVLRAVWTELREPKPGAVVASGPGADPKPGRKERRAAGRVGAGRVTEHPADQLEIRDPPERAGQRFDLGTELTVGRAAGCGVSLPEDTFVSQLHARVFRGDGGLFVEDLGSTNGTFVNDHKVSAPVPLGDGDRLKVGRTTMVLA